MPALAQPKQLSDHVWLIHAEHPHIDSGNVYLLTGATPTLIDCGSPRVAPRVIAGLERIGVPIEQVAQVIATHGDYDHVQGFPRLRERNPALRLRIHRLDLASVLGENSYRTASYVYGHAFEPLAAEACEALADGDVIPAGDGALTVLHTPGHTEGSICLLGEIDGRGVLFAGDTVGGAMRSLEGAALEVWADAIRAWTDSLARLTRLSFDWVLNGHEPETGLPISRARFDRMVAQFGTMLNPWYARGEEEPAPAPQG